MPNCQSPGQRAPAGDASSCHREDVDNQGIYGRFGRGRHRRVAGPPSRIRRLSKIPPVGHQIKATTKKRLVQHDAAIQNAQEFLRIAESLKEEKVKSLSEAEEALQRLKVQTPVVPLPPPRSVEALRQMVEQLQIERDALAGQVKHQNSTRMVEKMHPVQGSENAAQIVLERSAKPRALGEDNATDQQDLEGWDQFRCGWRGVRVGEEDPHRLKAHVGWQRPSKFQRQRSRGNCSRRTCTAKQRVSQIGTSR